MLFVGGVALLLGVSDFTGVTSVLPAVAESATTGTAGTPPGGGTTLIDEIVEFLVGVVVAAAVLALILAITGGFNR